MPPSRTRFDFATNAHPRKGGKYVATDYRQLHARGARPHPPPADTLLPLSFVIEGFKVVPAKMTPEWCPCICSKHADCPSTSPPLRRLETATAEPAAGERAWRSSWAGIPGIVLTGTPFAAVEIRDECGGPESMELLLRRPRARVLKPTPAFEEEGRKVLFFALVDQPQPPTRIVAEGIRLVGDGGSVALSRSRAPGRSPRDLPFAPLPEWLI